MNEDTSPQIDPFLVNHIWQHSQELMSPRVVNLSRNDSRLSSLPPWATHPSDLSRDPEYLWKKIRLIICVLGV